MAKKIEEKLEFFDNLRSGLESAIEHAKGARKDLRTTTLPRPPKELSAKEIANLRRRLATEAMIADVQDDKGGMDMGGMGGGIGMGM